MRIVYKKSFDKKFKKLSPQVKEHFYNRLRLFVNNKFDRILNNHSVEKVYPGCRSINITGDWRAIFYEENDAVIFITIGTHSELYE